MNNKAVFFIVLLVSAAFCSAQLQGGKSAPGFDVNKPVGRGARSDGYPSSDIVDLVPDDVPNPGPHTDGRPEEEVKRTAGGNASPDFNEKKPVGTQYSRSSVDLSVDDILGPPLPLPDPPPRDEDGRPEEEREKREFVGGNASPDFDSNKHVGTQYSRSSVDLSVDDILGPPLPLPDPPPRDEDGRPEEEREKREFVGGNASPDFDSNKHVGTQYSRSSVDLSVDDILGPPLPIPDPPPREDGRPEGDGHTEEKREFSGGNVAPDFDTNKQVGTQYSRSSVDLSVDIILGPGLPPDPPPKDDSRPEGDGHTEEKREVVGGNAAPDFDTNKQVGTQYSRSSVDLSVDIILGPGLPPDPPPKDDGRPEGDGHTEEKRSVGFQPPSGWKRMI